MVGAGCEHEGVAALAELAVLLLRIDCVDLCLNLLGIVRVAIQEDVWAQVRQTHMRLSKRHRRCGAAQHEQGSPGAVQHVTSF